MIVVHQTNNLQCYNVPKIEICNAVNILNKLIINQTCM